MDEAARALTGHAIATLAYRGARILRDAPAGFGGMRAGAPDWRTAWQAVPAGGWDDECRRFHAGLFEVDRALLDDAEPTLPLERVFQGPISDAFTHLGRLALLRRLAGAPIRGEVMVLSDVVPGKLGPEQTPPVREFR